MPLCLYICRCTWPCLQAWLYTVNFRHASTAVAYLSGARRETRLLDWALRRCAHRTRWWRLRQAADQRCGVALRFRAIQALLTHTARSRRAAAVAATTTRAATKRAFAALRKVAAWRSARVAAGLSRKEHGVRLVALLTLRRALRQWACSVAPRGPPRAAALSPTRLLAAEWQYGEKHSAGWQHGATLRAMLMLRRWSAHACTLRRRQATEEEAAIRYVRYVQDLLWHAVR